jgi:transposase
MDPPLSRVASMRQNGCSIVGNHSSRGGESHGTEDQRTRHRYREAGVFIVGMDDRGHVVLRKRMARRELLHFIAMLPPALIGMEACGSAHYWARRFGEHGHEVRLIAPQFVKAYVKSPKNDTRDAEAICEAVTRPTMRFVPIKQVEQQDL